MFREMRRKNQSLSAEACLDILRHGTSGVLAVSGDDGYPYAVPMSYVYHDNSIYFHSAKTGHKLDAISSSTKVSFCVIDQDEIIQEEYTSHFRSVIAFGRAHILESTEEKRGALMLLARRYSPDLPESRHQKATEKSLDAVCMIALSIEHLSGKEAIELVRKREK